MIDLSPLVSLGLLLVRPGTLILVAPPFGGVFAPAPVKIGLTFFLAVMLMPVATPPEMVSAVGVAVVIAREMAIGLALGLATRVLMAAAELGGHLAGFQLGLSYSATVDPASGVRNNLLSTLYSNLAMVAFLLVNAHHAFLRALRDSYAMLPLGRGEIGASLPQAITAMLGLVFSFGVRLAAPLIVVLVICELALGLVARSAPALNLMVVSAPIRLFLGLVLLGVIVPASFGVLSNLSSTVLQAGVRAAEAFR